MARPIYQHELTDPDFLWLINSFRESRSGYLLIETSCLPVVLIECSGPDVLINDDRTNRISEDPTDALPE